MTDLTGVQFGDLTVVKYSDRMGHRHRWLCRCACGKTQVIGSYNLIGSGRGPFQRSCTSCAQRGRSKDSRHHKHGKCYSIEYRTWGRIKQRCYRQNDRSYADYGGRGVKVCERWLNSFNDFYADMGPRPSSKHSIDRYPNNDGNYEPGNCRWATPEEQQNNRSNNRMMTFRGKTQTLMQWSRETGINYKTIYRRTMRGWPAEKILTQSTGSDSLETLEGD